MDQFTHGGSIGDIVYACAALKQFRRPVEFYLNRKAPEYFRQSEERLQSIMRLLEIQPYFSKVALSDGVVGRDLDEWRDHWWTGLNLSDMMCAWLGLHHIDRREPWFSVPEKKSLAPVVIHRSQRYHNSSFPWRQIVEKYKYNILFVGNDLTEYADFSQRFGGVSYWYSKDYLETAMIIAGCKVFIGNQSSPSAIAEGLKVTKILEGVTRGHWAWNCHWDRAGCQTVESGQVELPDI